ncbi:MAG: ClpXP protease specificity-enhancing factor SspB [Rickettsia endosymbiont of Bryobia graminum]|nr:ClpXP protease specificity-enhancing factor SspB [Rickettsia endosymbiont of Bryobia graminum]
MLDFIKKVLTKISSDKIQKNQTVYISYKTNHSEVILPDKIKERYPKEITIVIQHQFEDLILSEKGISITVSFDGIKENIYIPFDSIANFTDPNNGYNLKLKPEIKQPLTSSIGEDVISADNVIILDKFRKPKAKK